MMIREQRLCDCGDTVWIEWEEDGVTVWSVDYERHLCPSVANLNLEPPKRGDALDRAQGGGFLPKK